MQKNYQILEYFFYYLQFLSRLWKDSTPINLIYTHRIKKLTSITKHINRTWKESLDIWVYL